MHDVARTNLTALQSNYNGPCNVATGKTVTLLQLIEVLEDLCGWKVEKKFGPPREGDIMHSAAIVECMNNELGFTSHVELNEGLKSLLED